MSNETGIRMLFAFIKSIPLFSCGKEEEGSIPTDRQVPIGVTEASLSTRVSTRGVINTAAYKLGLFRTNANGYPPQYDAPILIAQPVGPHSQKYWWITVRWVYTHITLTSLYHLSITRRLRR